MNNEDTTKIELQANLKILINQLNDTFEDVDDEGIARGKVKDDILTIKEREEDAKYNVIIAKSGFNSYDVCIWCKIKEFLPYSVGTVTDDALVKDNYGMYSFTEDEFDDLIKYIKTLPDGDYQAKVAEHGKTLVKEGVVNEH